MNWIDGLATFWICWISILSSHFGTIDVIATDSSKHSRRLRRMRSLVGKQLMHISRPEHLCENLKYTEATSQLVSRNTSHSSELARRDVDNQTVARQKRLQFIRPINQADRSRRANHQRVKRDMFHGARGLTNSTRKLTNLLEDVPPKILVGQSITVECIPNVQNHQVLPCILDPKRADEFSPGYRDGDSPSVWNKFKQTTNENGSIVLYANYRAGDFAYLPCRILAANDMDTTIWEKGDAPLFASLTRFTKDRRFRLLHSEHNKTNVQVSSKISKKIQPLLNKNNNQQNDHRSDYSSVYVGHADYSLPKEAHKWDLIIDFLRPSDADTYTCRLVGRTRQLITYKIQVRKVETLIIYSKKKLVQISTPTLVLLGHPFNLTCSVQLNQNSGIHMSVDWFRPEHSYDGQAHPNVHYSAGNLPDKSQTVWPHLHEGSPTDVNRSAVVKWFAQSFVQLTSRPAFGNTVFKQLRTDQKFNYYSEVIFASTKATTMDAGFYECRAYEPTNQGQERILDRAIVNIVVHKPYPNKPLDHRDWTNKFGYLLADYWQMLSERQLAVHEQQIQNDGDAKLKEPALPLSDLENFGVYLPRERSQNPFRKPSEKQRDMSNCQSALESKNLWHCIILSRIFMWIFSNTFTT